MKAAVPEANRTISDDLLRESSSENGYVTDEGLPSGDAATVNNGDGGNPLEFRSILVRHVRTAAVAIVGISTFGAAVGLFVSQYSKRRAEAAAVLGEQEAQERAKRESALRLAREKVLLESWLDSQRKGRKGEEFWLSKSFVRPIQLYAVRSWKIVDNWNGLGIKWTVRIASSTRGGITIEKLWTISVSSDDAGNLKIIDVNPTIPD